MKEFRINWYREVIRIAREAQIDVMSGRAGLMAHESINPGTSEIALEMVDLEAVVDDIDEDVSEDELTEEDVLEAIEGDYDSILEIVNERINESLDANMIEKQLQNELTNNYNQLKTHWASIEFEIPKETEKRLDHFLQKLFINSMYPGLSEENGAEIETAAKQAIKACESDIDSIESKKTRYSLKKKFG